MATRTSPPRRYAMKRTNAATAIAHKIGTPGVIPRAPARLQGFSPTSSGAIWPTVDRRTCTWRGRESGRMPPGLGLEYGGRGARGARRAALLWGKRHDGGGRRGDGPSSGRLDVGRDGVWGLPWNPRVLGPPRRCPV